MLLVSVVSAVEQSCRNASPQDRIEKVSDPGEK
jgi:hypothetical protein